MTDDFFDNLPLLLPVAQAAQILGISRSAGYRATESGELATVRLGSRVYVITQSLRDLLAA